MNNTSISLRIPQELKLKVKGVADLNRRSLNSEIEVALLQYVSQHVAQVSKQFADSMSADSFLPQPQAPLSTLG